MHFSWWEVALLVAAMIVVARGYTRHLRRKIRRHEDEIARLKAQLEREQEFSAQLISLMPEDEEERSN
jgi:hypothetical protein